MSSKRILIDGLSVIVLSKIHDSFLCLLCSNILENPYQAICGCRFCFSCISNYLNDTSGVCPGQSEDCFGVNLNINNDLKPDVLAKREINKLLVRCPLHRCNKECEVREMRDHLPLCSLSTVVCTVCNSTVILKEFINHEMNECMETMVSCDFCNEVMKRKYLKNDFLNFEQNEIFCQFTDHRTVCSKQMVSCPYQSIGCTLNNGSYTAVSKHLVEKGIYHAELLLKQIDNINNEVTVINHKSILERNEITTKLNDLSIQHINEIESQTNKIGDLNNEMEQMKRSNLNILPRLHNIIERETETIVNRVQNAQGIVISQVYSKIEGLNGEFNNLKKISERNFKNVESVMTNNIDIIKELREMKERVNLVEENLKMKVENVRLDWIVEDFFLKNSATSPDFYTHSMGYKLNLGFEKKVKGHLSIYVYLKCGNYDDDLLWPFDKRITVKIFDQERLGRNFERSIDFISAPAEICNRKYFTETNGYGFPAFISYNELKEKGYLLKNKMIWVQCVVDELSRL